MVVTYKYFIGCDVGTIEELENLVLEYGFYNNSTDIIIDENRIVNKNYLNWSGWEEDLKRLSKDFPDRVFTCDFFSDEFNKWISCFKAGGFKVYKSN